MNIGKGFKNMKINTIVKASFLSLILISCDLDNDINLGNGYYLLEKGPNSTISKKDKNNSAFYDDIILGEILDCKFDKRFILVFRNASEKAKTYFNLQDSLWSEQRGKDTLQYWIIEKNENIVYGPLEKQEYLNKRQELKIPETLEINKKQ